MQLIVRRDLLDVSPLFFPHIILRVERANLLIFSQAEGWGVGPLMAQAAHATAAVWDDSAIPSLSY